jgi:hypothetical protein
MNIQHQQTAASICGWQKVRYKLQKVRYNLTFEDWKVGEQTCPRASACHRRLSQLLPVLRMFVAHPETVPLSEPTHATAADLASELVLSGLSSACAPRTSARARGMALLKGVCCLMLSVAEAVDEPSELAWLGGPW